MRNYDKLTNAELNIEKRKLEERYENLKINIAGMLNEMKNLDKEYYDIEKVVSKRKKGYM